jgi:Alpha/beta hydrolase of unknown function (DUF1400)
MFNRVRHLLLGVSSSALFIALGATLGANPGAAAERLSLRYGPFQRSVPVADLRTYAETGETTAELASLLSLVSRKERESLLEGLKFKVPLDVVAVDKLVRSPIGEQLLKKVAGITNRRDDAALPALRGGLVMAAASKEGLGVLSFLEAYPSPVLEINIKKALREGTDVGQLLQGFMQQPGS